MINKLLLALCGLAWTASHGAAGPSSLRALQPSLLWKVCEFRVIQALFSRINPPIVCAAADGRRIPRGSRAFMCSQAGSCSM